MAKSMPPLPLAPAPFRTPALSLASALLLASSLVLTGCAPEEKTMLLPQVSSAQSQEEGEASAADYTVKKIYTYSYDTMTGIGKSAFLSGCGGNEVHILSMDGQGADRALEYREVDYRYGFYDVAGEFQGILEHWDHWSDPAGGEMEDDLYIHRLLPSPDGKQLLVYIRSAFWDGLTVWLYTLGAPEPLLLYDGTAVSVDPLTGSFSPDGRWVAIDAAGSWAHLSPFIPVYDCSRATSREASEDAYWWMADTASRLLVPDHMLYEADLTQVGEEVDCWIWDAGLLSGDDGPRLLSLVREGDNLLCLIESPALPDSEIRPEATPFNEEAATVQGPACTKWYLPGYERTPYPLYRYSSDGTAVYYLSNPATLMSTGLTGSGGEDRVLALPNMVWDFLPLSSGDVLAALVQETGNAFEAEDVNSGGEHSMEQYIQENGIPANLQWHWDILSADLYLYPQGASEGHLLYKNLQNLIGMEYDEETGRILLETYEGADRDHRRCIILEL